MKFYVKGVIVKHNSIAKGVIAGISLSGVYFLFLLLIGGIEHAVGFISSLWYWLVIIILGFGLQFGLYTYIRQRVKSNAATAEVSASMGVSTGSMIACCLHLAVDLLPLVGLSALTIVLTSYQTPIILVGVFSNIIGVVFMVSLIKKHNLYSEDSKMSVLFQMNFKYIIIILFILGFSTVATTALYPEENIYVSISLDEQSIKSNKVLFSVIPEIDPGVNIRLMISMNTHSVNLDFDMLKVSKLVDPNGNEYFPDEWQGPDGGGHHRSGVLLFSDIPEDLRELNFIMIPGGRFQTLNFKWEIE